MCQHYLLIVPESVVSQHRSVLDLVRCVVDKDCSVLNLQDLDAMSHHRRHAELTQLRQR